MSEVPASRPPGGPRLLVEAAAAGALALAYLWLFRLYGFDVVDEGTLLAQIDRVARGGRPYVDFETGYTPGFFALYAALWQGTGDALVVTRTFGVCLHALTAALLYACAARVAGRAVAASVTLLQVAFLLPVSARFGAHFNVPYPGWLVAPLALAAQVAIAERARTGRVLPVALAGLAAGAAFSVKPNAGLLLLGGAALALPVAWPSARVGRIAGLVLRAAAPLAVLAVLGSALDPGYALAVVAPVAAAALAAVGRDAEPGAAPEGGSARASRPLLDLAVLGAAFLAPVLPWLVPLFSELGAARIVSEVLLLDGGGVVGAYLLPYPAPAPSTLALAAALVAAGLVARSARARLAPWLLAAGAVAAAVLAAEPRLAAENALLWLPLVALVVGLLAAPRAPAAERALLVFAAVQQVQMFPRPDFLHLAQIAPTLWLAGAAAWARAAAAWREHSHEPVRSAALGRALLAGVVALALARVAPALAARLGEPLVPLGPGRLAHLSIARPAAPAFAWLGDAVREVAERTRPGDAVFAFPDLAGVVFAAERTSPFYYLYFVPGRPGPAGERRTVAELARVRPPLALVGRPRVAAFRGAEEYFGEIAAALGRDYREVASGEGFRVLAREPGT